jgi:hypothetical protein
MQLPNGFTAFRKQNLYGYGIVLEEEQIAAINVSRKYASVSTAVFTCVGKVKTILLDSSTI